MKAAVLVDNLSDGKLLKEWGLSFFIEYDNMKVLLDTGASAKFSENAKVLASDLKTIDFGVLSHAHYDHADGMEIFFKENKKAAFYVRKPCEENCYGKAFIFTKYIGIEKGILEKHKERILFVEGDFEIRKGVWLIPHKKKISGGNSEEKWTVYSKKRETISGYV